MVDIWKHSFLKIVRLLTAQEPNRFNYTFSSINDFLREFLDFETIFERKEIEIDQLGYLQKEIKVTR